MKNFIRLVITILLLAAPGVIHSEEQNQKDSNTMELIRENTYQTARHTEKGRIDYITFGISIFAGFIAFVTLYFSIRTYLSQKKTEKNTLRWSAKLERANLRRIMFNLFCHYRKLLAIEILLDDKKHPATSCFENMKIDISDLHLNENFGDGIDYAGLYRLSELLKRYNTLIETRIAQSQNPNYEWKKEESHPVYIGCTSFCSYFPELEVIYYALETIEDIYPSMFERKEKDKLSLEQKQEFIAHYTDFDYIDKETIIFYKNYKVAHSQREDYIGLLKTNFDSKLGLLDISLSDSYWAFPYLIFLAEIRHHLNGSYKEIQNRYIPHYEDALFKEQFEFLTNPMSLCDVAYNRPHKLPLAFQFIEKLLFLFRCDSFGYELDKISDLIIENPTEIKDRLDIFDSNAHTYYTQLSRLDFYRIMNPIHESDKILTIPLEDSSLVGRQLLEESNIANSDAKKNEIVLKQGVIDLLSAMYISVDYKDIAVFRVKEINR